MCSTWEKVQAAFQLNYMARSLKYKISLTSLLDLMSNKHGDRECRLAVVRWRNKNGKYMTKNLCLFQQVEYLCWFGYLNRLGKYNFCTPPLPFRNLPQSSTLLPFGISVTLRGEGYEYFLEPHNLKKGGLWLSTCLLGRMSFRCLTMKILINCNPTSLHMNQVAHQASAYLHFQ